MYWKKLAILAGLVISSAGCQCRQYRSAEYGLAPEAEADMGMAATTEKTFVDRHPLLAAPRNYYRDGANTFVGRVFMGTFVGVPVGVAREAWQVVYGQ